MSVWLVVVLGTAAWWLLFRKKPSYWQLRGVPSKPAPSVFSILKMLFSEEVPTSVRLMKSYQEWPEERFVGMEFPKHSLFVRDPELVKNILVKDFDYFTDRGIAYDEEVDPLSGHLFNMDGVRWKNLRIKLSPTFTSGKMKRMYPLMVECSTALDCALQKIAGTGEAIEVKDLLSRFTTDVIGTCAFGVNCNSFETRDAEFHKQGQKLFENNTGFGSWYNIGRLFLPKWKYFESLASSTKKSFQHFFLQVVKDNVEYREKHGVQRHDFLDLLIQIKKKGKIVDDSVDLVEDPFLKVPVSTSSDDFKFTDNTLAAQAFVFFAAGFETSSTTMTFCLLELANNQEIQNKVLSELQSVIKKHGSVTYEAIAEMGFLDQVVTESLRKYPPLPLLFRKVTKPYQVPGTDLILERGLSISIPLSGLQHDPKYFPDPERFDPDRFSKEAKGAINTYTFLPFGEGPRICIGMRFGLLQTKLGLATVLSRYRVRPSTRTTYPVKFDPHCFTATVKDGCYLQFSPHETALRSAGL